ncbi:MAG: LrgB family protein [Ahrensia sp.]|nr:LrgB family protein [Ahrensia sp.]
MGSCVAAISAIVLAQALGLPEVVVLSLAQPEKASTAPVALGVSEAIGGIPTLTAVLVILTGIVGAITCAPIDGLLRVLPTGVRGFCGLGSPHMVLPAARAFQVNETAGAFAGIGMALNALLTSIIVPTTCLPRLSNPSG